MSTLHNQLYGNMIGFLLYNHLKFFDVEERTLVYEGEDMPEGMYEPYMRFVIKAGWAQEPLGRVLKVRFIAGAEGSEFQECCIALFPEIPSGVIITHPKPHREYSMCHIFNSLAHWCIELVAEKEGLPSCCCPDQPDDSGHQNECSVPDYSANDGEPVGEWGKVVPKGDNVVQLQPRLRVVKNESSSDT